MKSIPCTAVSGSDGALAIIKVGDFLYTAGGDTLCVYDVSVADRPRRVRRMRGFGDGRQLAAGNGRLYLTARNYGLWILDIANPAAPKLIRRFDTVELATGVAVSGDFVFVTHRIFGVEILDCSDPRHPRHCSMIRTAEAQSAAFRDGLLYVGDWGVGRLTVIDVSNPYSPRLLSESPLGGFGDGVTVAGDLCCVATGLNRKGDTSALGGDGHGLELFRISPDGRPRHLSRLEFPRLQVKTNDFWSVRIAGNTAFVADTHNGMFQADLTDPEHPVCVGRIELPGISRLDAREGALVRISVPDCVGGVAIGKGVLYLAGQKTGLHFAEIPEADETKVETPAPYRFSPQPAKAETVPGFRACEFGGQVRRVAVDARKARAFVACSHAGIRILNLAGAEAEVVGSHPADCVYDVAYRDGKLYSAEGSGGLAIYAVEGNALRELGRFKGRGRFFQLLRLSGNGRFLVCGSRDGVLRFLDVSDPADIRLAWRHLHGGLLYGDTMPEHDCDGVMPVIWPYSGTAWYDLSGDRPRQVYNDCQNRPAGQCEGITWWNGRFLMSTLKNTFRLLDPSDCGRTWTEIPDGCSGVPSADGNVVAFSHRRDGDVRVFRLTKRRAEPIPERSFAGISGTPDRVVFFRGRMLIPCGYQGLLIENANSGGDR